MAINLIPEEYARHPELNLSRKFIVYVGAIGLSVGALVAVTQLVGWYQYDMGNQIRQTEQRSQLLEGKIEQYQHLLTTAHQVQQEVATLERLVGNHRYWTQIFQVLERVTIDEVYFTSLTSSSDGSLELVARGRDYGSVARQLVAMREASDVIASVQITGATAATTADGGGVAAVNFNVSLHLQPSAWRIPLTLTP